MTRRSLNALSVALAAIYAVAGGAKLLGVGLMVERFQLWGYSDVLMRVVGMLELMGAIGLAIPRVASPAAVGLMLLMLGAVYTHLFRGFAPLAVVPAVFIALLAIVARRRMEEPQSWLLSWRREVSQR